MFNKIETKLLALYVQWKINQTLRRLAMKNVTGMTISITGIKVNFKAIDFSSPQNVEIGEIKQDIKTDVDMDIAEMKNQQDMVEKIPVMITGVIDACLSTVPAILLARRMICESNREQSLLDKTHTAELMRLDKEHSAELNATTTTE